MGPMGVYHVFESASGEQGGMVTKTPQAPAPFWLFYFNVDAIDAAAGRIKAKGGRIAHGPNETPNGRWVVQGLDPQGAMFGLAAAKR